MCDTRPGERCGSETLVVHRDATEAYACAFPDQEKRLPVNPVDAAWSRLQSRLGPLPTPLPTPLERKLGVLPTQKGPSRQQFPVDPYAPIPRPRVGRRMGSTVPTNMDTLITGVPAALRSTNGDHATQV
jgi:hypothetical protein